MSEDDTTEQNESGKPRFTHGQNNKAIRPFLVWGKLLTTFGLIGPIILVLLLVTIPSPLVKRFLPWIGIDGLDLLLFVTLCFPIVVAGFWMFAYFIGYSNCQKTHDIADEIDDANRNRHGMSPPIRSREQAENPDKIDGIEESVEPPYISIGAFIPLNKLQPFAIVGIVVGAGLQLATELISSTSITEDFVFIPAFPSVIADLLFVGGVIAILYVVGYRQCMSINGIDMMADAALQKQNRAYFDKERHTRARGDDLSAN